MRWCLLGAAVLFGLGASAAHAGQGAAKPSPAPSSVPTSAPTAVASPAATAVSSPIPAGSSSAAATSKTASTGADGQAAPVSGPAGNTLSAAFRPAHRSPVVATLLAWIPGVVVHGSGHMYAHSWMKGLGLFALEGASVYLMYEDYRWYEEPSHGPFQPYFSNNNNNNNNSLPSNLGFAYQQAGIALVALPAFIFTWVDDICGASIAAHQFNQLQDQQAQTISMHLEPRPGGAVLALSSNF
ncbi:MAG TPA: hypothetical protein VK914_13045 [bacterium]|jgi:hypothetical protein|nr:hypothetical protein [bacterium]